MGFIHALVGKKGWFVKVRGEVPTREHFFELASEISKIPRTHFKVKLPSVEEMRAQKTDVILIGSGMRIAVKLGCKPREIGTNVVHWSVMSFADKDWSISFDRFPGVEVNLRTNRGRPRKDALRAEIIAEKSEGKSSAEIARLRGMSSDAVRHYPVRGVKSKTSGN